MTSSYEQRLVAWLRRELLEQDPQIGQGDKRIIIEDVHVEKGGPEGDMVVILFREVRRPHCMFGFRIEVYELGIPPTPDESCEGWGAVIYGNFREHVEAADMGLPQDCDPDGITWI